jgi:KDO2-lipid IV(A) lauroyltransferase
MAKAAKPILDFTVYVAVRLLVGVIQAIPYRAGITLADGLAWLVYQVDRRHRQVAHENLAFAFPDTLGNHVAGGVRRRDAMVRATLRHFCRLVIEMIWLPRLFQVGSWKKHIDLGDNPAPLVRLLLSGRPMLLATGHFGNWEMAGYMLGLLGFKTFAIARVLDNPHLEKFLRRFRQRTGQAILAKKGDFELIQGVLGSGGILATLADQDAGPKGQFVPFFHRPASTHKALALMALEYDTPVVVVGLAKVGEPLRYRLEVEEILEPADFKNEPASVAALTTRYTAALERMIRRHPEQYFWLHRRWKHQPAARKPKKNDSGMVAA